MAFSSAPIWTGMSSGGKESYATDAAAALFSDGDGSAGLAGLAGAATTLSSVGLAGAMNADTSASTWAALRLRKYGIEGAFAAIA
jgi:hypothetical protein